MSLFSDHADNWRACEACELKKDRIHVVLARGRVPAPILFVGEAPGDSENILGIPFCGPAGRHSSCGLDSMIEQAIDGQYDYAITNLVGCIPSHRGIKAGAPDGIHIKACRPRLEEFIEICQPRLIVCIGELAWMHLPRYYVEDNDVATIKITHPAAILRMNIAQRGLMVQRNVVAIEEALEQL